MTVYKKILLDNLPILYNLYDQDPISQTRGVGDRLYWGWKVSDFANATLQGGVHSLAIALDLGLVENESKVLEIIDHAILAIPSIQSKKGSLQEAYPSEHSWCVTALVAFDALSAIQYLGERITPEKNKAYLEVIQPLIQFISEQDEEHAVISNHLATGVAAIVLWNKISGSRNEHWKTIFKVIIDHQSIEGWHTEYEGADPGYATLGLYYLASAALVLKNEERKEVIKSITSAVEYLQYFIHPDHTIGGLYGSRNTEVYYPGGIVALSEESEIIRLLACEMQSGIAKGNHLLPQFIDVGNYIPCINSYAMAAWYAEKIELKTDKKAPAASSFEKDFKHSGIYIRSNERYHAIVNYKKGGTIKVFDKSTSSLDCEDGGLVADRGKVKLVSTQLFQDKINFDAKEIETDFFYLNKSEVTPLKTIILRCLALTIFRSVWLGNIFKKQVVKLLMTGKQKVGQRVNRRFEFKEDGIVITESLVGTKSVENPRHVGKFKSIHMASSGYYLPQHANSNNQSKYVKFIWH